MKLYAVVDKKSGCAEYFIASCDEDALRIWSVMCMSSRPMYEFLDDYQIEVVTSLAMSRDLSGDPMFDGIELKRLLDARKEKNKDG